jgi:uncharacterized OB-fold protein
VIEAIGTYLPSWGAVAGRDPGPDEDAVTLAVAAGLQAMGAATSTVVRVVVVSRDLPTLEGGNAAALLAGLGLAPDTEVVERLGGGPSALEAVADAAAGTLVIGVDLTAGRAGAAAALGSDHGASVLIAERMNRSLPVVTRDAAGSTTDYGDPRLLRELGVAVSLKAAGIAGGIDAVTGLVRKDAAALCTGDPPALPTSGASAPLFALAALLDSGDRARLLAIEQATVVLAEVEGRVTITRDECVPQKRPEESRSPGPEIAISLAAYERAFDAKLRLVAGRCTTCGTLAYPPRLRCLGCGSEAPVESVALPREAVIYSCTTVHVPVPGLRTPYTVVLAELGDTGVRFLVQLSGVPAGRVEIGDRGQLAFRRVALRSGVPDYGYAFVPERVLSGVRP